MNQRSRLSLRQAEGLHPLRHLWVRDQKCRMGVELQHNGAGCKIPLLGYKTCRSMILDSARLALQVSR